MNGIDVVGAGHHRARGDVLSMDAAVTRSVEDVFAAVAPDVVVNAIGERRPEHWNARQLYALNVALPRLVAQL